jgi:peptidoglycan/xylan/chitin deacetylase (PgdA/CDA1 family)
MIAALITLVVAVAGYIALSLLPPALVKHRLRKQLALRSRGRLAITYDDGPGPKMTPPLLSVLREHAAKASFFFVGFRAQRHPEMCDAIAAAGHEIGNHTHHHRNAWRTLARPWRAVLDVRQGYQTMSRWMAGDGLFRPPFGKLTFWTWLASCRRGIRLSFWTADGGDTWPELPDPDVVAQRIVSCGGAVVLLHSHDRGEDRQRYVLRITESLLREARERGLQVCTMSEILNAPVPSQSESQRESPAGPARGCEQARER